MPAWVFADVDGDHSIAPGGKRKLTEAIERADLLMHDLVPTEKNKNLEELSEFLSELGASAYIN